MNIDNYPRLEDERYVYTLLLEGDNYYVGTTIDIQKRFKEHLSGKGAQWTGLHKPVKVIDIYKTNKLFPNGENGYELEEAICAIELMKEHGFACVRGGFLNSPTELAIKMQLLSLRDHMPYDVDLNGIDFSEIPDDVLPVARATYLNEEDDEEYPYQGQFVASDAEVKIRRELDDSDEVIFSLKVNVINNGCRARACLEIQALDEDEFEIESIDLDGWISRHSQRTLTTRVDFFNLSDFKRIRQWKVII